MKCIEDEIPFDLPDGWAWERLGAVAEAIGDGDHQPPPQTSFGVPFLVISNVSGGQLSFENTRFVSEEYFSQLPETRKPRNGDLLFTVTGSYGIPVLVDTDDQFCFQRHIAIVRPCIISNRYLYAVLGSSYVKSICDAKATGTAQKTVGLATLRELLIPVAPYKEQMQIYAQTQDALSIVNSISSDKEDLLNIIENTKAKILDLAIRGQLVPQNPTDEPASALLERIRAEKEELIRQGIIKRDKKESVIFRGEDNSYYENIDDTIVSIEKDIPFELPDGWAWCRVRSISSVRGGKRLPKGADFSDTPTTHAYIRVTDMKNRTVNTADLKYISDHVYEQIKSYTISSKDLYVTIAGTIGVVGEVPDNLDGMNLTENAVKVCDITINKKYLCYILLSSFVQQQFQDKTHQVAMPKLALERILTTLIPLPPLREQERLVNVIDKSLSWLDGIQTLLA